MVGGGELVQERMARRDGALSDPSRTIRPSTARLEETMPMLRYFGEHRINERYLVTYDAGRAEHGRICQCIDDIQGECVALVRSVF